MAKFKVECITLDDSDSDEVEQKFSETVNTSASCYIRCDFCLEPGWISQEVDPVDHRLRVHASALFYCDVCDNDDRGAKGFATFSDVSKHVVKENRIEPDDIKNIHDLIRIPGNSELLKQFRCTFCKGNGFKFVGLSEEEFLKHVTSKHGLKAARARPDKLLKECRICEKVFITDEELTRHVTRKHLEDGVENRFPFAGFGPRTRSAVIRQDGFNQEELFKEGPSGISKRSRSSSGDIFDDNRKRKITQAQISISSSPSRNSKIRDVDKGKTANAQRLGISKRSRSSSSDGSDDNIKRKIRQKQISNRSKNSRKRDKEKTSKARGSRISNRSRSSSSDGFDDDIKRKVAQKLISSPSKSNKIRDKEKNAKVQGSRISKRSRSSSSDSSADNLKRMITQKQTSIPSRNSMKREDNTRTTSAQGSSQFSAGTHNLNGKLKSKRLEKGRERRSISSVRIQMGEKEKSSPSRNKVNKRKSKSSDSDQSEKREKEKRKYDSFFQGNKHRYNETDEKLSKPKEKNYMKTNSYEQDKIPHKSVINKALHQYHSTEKVFSCDICFKDKIKDIKEHLCSWHKDLTFVCTFCGDVFVRIEMIMDHMKTAHDKYDDGRLLLKSGLIHQPACLLSFICDFCRPRSKQIIATQPNNFMYQVFDHMDQHEDQHKGVEKTIIAGIDYHCRICIDKVWKDLSKLQAHIDSEHSNSESCGVNINRGLLSGKHNDTWKIRQSTENKNLRENRDVLKNEKISKWNRRSCNSQEDRERSDYRQKSRSRETESRRKQSQDRFKEKINESEEIRKRDSWQWRTIEEKDKGEIEDRSERKKSSKSKDRGINMNQSLEIQRETKNKSEERQLKESYEQYLRECERNEDVCKKKSTTHENFKERDKRENSNKYESSEKQLRDSYEQYLRTCRENENKAKKRSRSRSRENWREKDYWRNANATMMNERSKSIDNKKERNIRSTSRDKVLRIDRIGYKQEHGRDESRAMSHKEVATPNKTFTKILVENQVISINKHLHRRKIADDAEKERINLLRKSNSTRERDGKEGNKQKNNITQIMHRSNPREMKQGNINHDNFKKQKGGQSRDISRKINEFGRETNIRNKERHDKNGGRNVQTYKKRSEGGQAQLKRDNVIQRAKVPSDQVNHHAELAEVINKMMQMQCIVSEVIQEIVSNAFEIALETKSKNEVSNKLHITALPVQSNVVEHKLKCSSPSGGSENVIFDAIQDKVLNSNDTSKSLLPIKDNIRIEDKYNESIGNVMKQTKPALITSDIALEEIIPFNGGIEENKMENKFVDIKANDAKDYNNDDESSLLNVDLMGDNYQSDMTSVGERCHLISSTSSSLSSIIETQEVSGEKEVNYTSQSVSTKNNQHLDNENQTEMNKVELVKKPVQLTRTEEISMNKDSIIEKETFAVTVGQESNSAECKGVVKKKSGVESEVAEEHISKGAEFQSVTELDCNTVKYKGAVEHETKGEKCKVSVEDETKDSNCVDVVEQESQSGNCKNLEDKSISMDCQVVVQQTNKSEDFKEVMEQESKDTESQNVIKQDSNRKEKSETLVNKRRSNRKVQNIKSESPKLLRTAKTKDNSEKNKLPKVIETTSCNKAPKSKAKKTDPSVSCISAASSRSGRSRRQRKLLDM